MDAHLPAGRKSRKVQFEKILAEMRADSPETECPSSRVRISEYYGVLLDSTF
jgi:hypothetical protein